MTLATFIFWMCMGVLLLGGGAVGGLVYRSKKPGGYRVHVISAGFLVWLCLALLGWRVFGALVHS